MYDYYGFYSTPMMSYINMAGVIAVCAVIAVIAAVVLFFTFMNKKHEGRYKGFAGKLYNFLNFNRFYTENIVKFFYVIIACVLTVLGIVQIVMGSFIGGLLTIVAGNVAVRISFELLMMFIILCRKTVSIDKRIAGIEKFYQDHDADEEYNSDSDFNEEMFCNDQQKPFMDKTCEESVSEPERSTETVTEQTGNAESENCENANADFVKENEEKENE